MMVAMRAPRSEQGGGYGAPADRPNPRELLLQHEGGSVGHAGRSGDFRDDHPIMPMPNQTHGTQPEMEREFRAFEQRRHGDGELAAA